ncbi:hypothetical protein BH23PSE1_BH23PSE1_15980 [soil metagenome]
MRDLCLGIEAVLADGRVLRGLSPLRKNNAGFDLKNLLIGSEGTLGIVTAASLRLFPRPAESATAWLAAAGPEAALALLDRLRGAFGEALSAFEFMHRQGLDFLAETMPEVAQPLPEKPEWSVLVEAGAGPGARIGDRLETALAGALEAGLACDALVAQNEAQRRAFWRVREALAEANRKIGAVTSHDISLPVARLAGFIERGRRAVAAIEPDLRINCFGHLGDGNLHYNTFPPPGRSREAYDGLRGQITEAVHDAAHALGGSVAAEHGIGRLKTGDLVRYGDPVKLEAMRAIKAALDPHGILNPGAVLGEG